MKNFDFLATLLVIGGNGKGKWGSISDGSGLRLGLGVLAGVRDGVTGRKVYIFSELLEVCRIDPVSMSFELVPRLVDHGVNYILSDESGDESRLTSLSEKNLFLKKVFCFCTLKSFFRSIQSRGLNCDLFQIDFISLGYRGDCFEVNRFHLYRNFFRVLKLIPKQTAQS